jgi:hypothetical protein
VVIQRQDLRIPLAGGDDARFNHRTATEKHFRHGRRRRDARIVTARDKVELFARDGPYPTYWMRG